MNADPEGFIVVAGGSGAIGGAVCRCLARDGSNVVIGYLTNRGRAEEVAEEVRGMGRLAIASRLDLSDPDVVVEHVGALSLRCRIDGLVYAAGPRVRMTHLSAITPKEFKDQLIDDAVAFYNLAHALLPLLRQQRGAIVAVTTAALARYSAKDVLSVAPKAAVQGVVRAIAAEEGRFGVRANCVGVGLLEEGLYDSLVEGGGYTEEFLAAARKNAALRRFGAAVDVAEAVAFFMSSRADWISGQSLNVDGGYAI